MGFAKARATVKKERIVAGTGTTDDAFGCSKSEIVVGADDEVVDGVFGIETGFLVFGGF